MVEADGRDPMLVEQASPSIRNSRLDRFPAAPATVTGTATPVELASGIGAGGPV
jgi:hypothetical protein